MSIIGLTIAIALAGALSGEQGPTPPPPPAEDDAIVVQARPHSPADPFVAVNAQSFAVAQQVDTAFIGPVSLAYKSKVPGPIRDGVRNFLNNTREPVVFLNFLLQLKPGKAVKTFGRFAINSTIGGAGLFDVAKRPPFGLPRRPNGFANTMGYYGVKPGPFLFLPLIGPTTVRDAIGAGIDRLVLPFAFGAPFTEFAYGASTATLSGIDHRVQFDEELRAEREDTDPYRRRRELYLRTRQAEIEDLRGSGITIAASPAAKPEAVRIALAAPLPADTDAPALDAPEAAPEEQDRPEDLISR